MTALKKAVIKTSKVFVCTFQKTASELVIMLTLRNWIRLVTLLHKATLAFLKSSFLYFLKLARRAGKRFFSTIIRRFGSTSAGFIFSTAPRNRTEKFKCALRCSFWRFFEKKFGIKVLVHSDSCFLLTPQGLFSFWTSEDYWKFSIIFGSWERKKAPGVGRRHESENTKTLMGRRFEWLRFVGKR